MCVCRQQEENIYSHLMWCLIELSEPSVSSRSGFIASLQQMLDCLPVCVHASFKIVQIYERPRRCKNQFHLLLI